MTETKTFKNPALEYNADAWHSKYWGWEVEGEVFIEDEWDMEVTFTKKAPKPEVGGTCRWKNTTEILTIMSINGSWVWVTPDPEESGWIEDIDNLTDVKPWQPV